MKTWFKHIAQRSVGNSYPAFVVSSFGRSGSTLVWDAIANGLAARYGPIPTKISRRIVRDSAWDLGTTVLRRGIVYKTHDYPEALAMREDVRSVFLFGSALEAAISVYSCKDTYGLDWIRKHFEHLHSNRNFDELFEIDALGFRDQLNAWCGFDQGSVLCLNYNNIWDHQKTLNEFCGFHVPLPLRRPRSRKVCPPDALDAAHAVYDPIDRIIDALPTCFVSGRKIGALLEKLEAS